MKIRLPHYFLGLFAIVSYNTLSAQEYEHLEISSGFNHDVIANAVNPANVSTTIGVDNANFAFMSADFQATAGSTPPAYGLPVTGLINSAETEGLSYQLGDYSLNNSLRIHGTILANPVNEGTLTFENQVSATKLFILTTSGSGVATITTTINFTDETTQVITGSQVPDWYNSTLLPVAASGFGRVNRTNNVLENPAGNPRMYQMTLDILPENQTKLIESIDVVKTSTAEGAINIFAVTAELLGTCPAPSGLVSTSGATSGTVEWTAAALIPTGGYDYYISTENTVPDEDTEGIGNVAPDDTSVVFEGLETGVTYYVWIRSNCGEEEQGQWVATSFTTGQITFTYTLGDISTLYNTNVTPASTTECPGELTIEVPDGYQIASLSTSYSMTAALNAYMSEQRTFLYCNTNNTGEDTVTAGIGGTEGTFNYNRSGITIANGLTGTVELELRAFRTWGGSGCASNYNKVNNNTWTVTITYECVTPDTPTAEAQTVCGGTTVAELEAATSAEDAVLKWYTDAEGGEALAADAEVISGTYYVSQQRFTCESERQAVEVTVNTVPELTVEAQTVCVGTTVVELPVETATGIVYWYATEDGEVLLDETVLETGIYYVSQMVDGCESGKTEVSVTVNATAEPTAEEQQVFCSGGTVSQLFASADENGELNWYASEDSEDTLDPEAEITEGSYFVSQTVDGCESARIEVMATVNPIPDVPDAAGMQDYNEGQTLDDLTVALAEGGTANWYIMNGEGQYVAVNADTVLQDDMTYYVTQSVMDCESDYTAIEVNEVLGTLTFDLSELSVYPNPATDVITVTNRDNISQITLVNLLGQTVMQQTANAAEVQLNIATLAQGAYILQVQSGSKVASIKVIKN